MLPNELCVFGVCDNLLVEQDPDAARGRFNLFDCHGCTEWSCRRISAIDKEAEEPEENDLGSIRMVGRVVYKDNGLRSPRKRS
jgi:hypothetical protein